MVATILSHKSRSILSDLGKLNRVKFQGSRYKMPRQSPPSKKSVVPLSKPQLPVQVASPTPSSFGQIVKEGLAFGVGQAVAHRAVASLAGAFSSAPPSNPNLPCEKEWSAFEACMKTKSADEYCGAEQASFTQCMRLTKPPVHE